MMIYISVCQSEYKERKFSKPPSQSGLVILSAWNNGNRVAGAVISMNVSKHDLYVVEWPRMGTCTWVKVYMRASDFF